MELTELDKKIIRLLQEEIPLAPEPYKAMAEALEIEESQLLKRIQEYKHKGILRRIGAVLRHRKVGFTANAMVVWEVEPHRAKEVGDKMAAFPEVTHCYERPTYQNWPYNLFTMIHGTNQEVCYEIAEELSQVVDVKKYKLLFSSEELKKTSMKYFCV